MPIENDKSHRDKKDLLIIVPPDDLFPQLADYLNVFADSTIICHKPAHSVHLWVDHALSESIKHFWLVVFQEKNHEAEVAVQTGQVLVQKQGWKLMTHEHRQTVEGQAQRVLSELVLTILSRCIM